MGKHFFIKLILLFSIFITTSTSAGGTGNLNIVSFWVGPGDFARVEFSQSVAAIGQGCTRQNWVAIRTDNPNYDAMISSVLTSLTAGIPILEYLVHQAIKIVQMVSMQQ